MKLFDKIKRRSAGADVPDERIVADILSELERRREERLPLELQWRLNAAFMAGDQRCEINPFAATITETYPAYDYEERGVYNRIAPLMDTRLANLKTVSFDMAVHPATEDGDDLQKAGVCSELLNYAYASGGFDYKKNMLLQWAELTGSAFLLSSWDKRDGERIGVREDGSAVMSGGLRYTLLSAYEVFPESLYRQQIGEQNSIIVEQVLPAKEIESTYGIECKGREMTHAVLSRAALSEGGAYGGGVRVKDSERVVTYMQAPTSECPEGVMVQIAGGRIVYFGQLPVGEMPLTVFRVKESAGQFFGKSVIEDLIPLQRAYNGCKNKIHDYISTLAANSMLVEEGSIDVEEMEENGTAPGSAVVYRRGYTPPTPLRHEPMPAEVYAECDQLCRDMEYVAGVSQLMVVGSSAAKVTSGKAINALREIDTTRMALCAENMRVGAMETAKLWLKLYKAFCPRAMTLKITGDALSGEVLTWSSEDINSYDVYFKTVNELRVSAEERKAAFFEAYDRGLFADDEGRVPEEVRAKAIALLNGEGESLHTENMLQHNRAKRENSLFSASGIIPTVGEMDDHEAHIDEHRRFALQTDFEWRAARNGASAEAFYAHIREHEEGRHVS